MADIHIRHGWAWVLFVVMAVTGAALMTSQDPTRVRIGIALVVAPWVLFSLLLLVFYFKSRSDALLGRDEE